MANSNRPATRAISAGNAHIYTPAISKNAADSEQIASRQVNTAASRLKSTCNGDIASREVNTATSRLKSACKGDVPTSFESNIAPRSGDRIDPNVPW